MLRSNRHLLGALLALAMASTAFAQFGRPKATEGVGIDQKLNAPVPLDLNFHDEAGQLVPLRQYFGDKPVVIQMVYFTCTSLCPMSIRESVLGLKGVSLTPGKDYDVIIVSFDPSDTPQMAAQKKAEYAKMFGKPGFNEGWHFLTGDQAAIARLTQAVGWRYRWDAASRQFVHAAGIMVATPDGKMSRYFYGVDYARADLRMALVEASKHRIASPVDYVLLFCFHYDATQGRYSLTIVNILKLAAALTILGLGTLIFLLMRTDNKKPKRANWKEVRHVG